MMSSPLKRRLLQSVGATSLGPILTAIIQLVNVPVFLHFWGAKLYGEWLVISALPVYFGLTDFGIGSVAANEMTMMVARGEKNSALEVFQSTWLLTTVVSLSFTTIVALGIWILPIEQWIKVVLLSRGQVMAILCILCVYILLDMQWTVLAAGFRCDGNYALGTLIGNAVRLTTNASAVVAVAFHATPVAVAVCLVVFRLAGNRAGQIALRRKSPWLHYGYRHASTAAIRKLFRPGIAYLAIPAGNAFILQGMTVVVGSVLGPVAVVMYTTVRTLTRFVYQMSDMITNSIWAEMSAAIGSGNQLLARNLHRVACQATIGCSGAAILFLMVFGRLIYGIWTHHRINLDQTLYYILLVEVLANALWFTSSIVPISCNRHERQSIIYVLSTASSLPIAYLLLRWIGLPGAGVSLLVADICMIAYVLTNSLTILHDTPGAFLRALVSAPSLAGASAETAGR
jgi:O-antigen/teichoic acid export membrane protein